MKKGWTQRDTACFVVQWARCNSSVPEDQTHSLQSRDARGNWRVRRTQTRRSSGDWSCGYTTRSWSFRPDPDPKIQHTLRGVGRQSSARGIIMWAGVVWSSFSRTLTKEVFLSSPETEYCGVCSVGAELMYLGEPLELWDTQHSAKCSQTQLQQEQSRYAKSHQDSDVCR